MLHPSRPEQLEQFDQQGHRVAVPKQKRVILSNGNMVFAGNGNSLAVSRAEKAFGGFAHHAKPQADIITHLQKHRPANRAVWHVPYRPAPGFRAQSCQPGPGAEFFQRLAAALGIGNPLPDQRPHFRETAPPSDRRLHHSGVRAWPALAPPRRCRPAGADGDREVSLSHHGRHEEIAALRIVGRIDPKAASPCIGDDLAIDFRRRRGKDKTVRG